MTRKLKEIHDLLTEMKGYLTAAQAVRGNADALNYMISCADHCRTKAMRALDHKDATTLARNLHSIQSK